MQLDNTLYETFKKLTQELIKNKIKFSVAGAFAVSLYTQPRATSDIDLATFLGKKIKDKVASIMERNFELLPKEQEIIPMRFYEIWRNIIINDISKKTIVPIDFISIPDDYLSSVLKKSIILQIDKLNIPFLSKEDLIIMKLDSTRAKDIDDIEQIVKGPGKVDYDYIKTWAKKYSLHTKNLEKIRKNLKMDFGPEL